MMRLAKLIVALSLLTCTLGADHSVLAATPFQENNPDIRKYDFVRSYISALSYFNQIKVRWKKSKPRKEFTGGDLPLMQGYVTLLIKENADLRIAKNYMAPYLQIKSPLIKTVANQFMDVCQSLITINDAERKIWDQWYAVKSTHKDTRANEKAFIKALLDLSNLRDVQYKNLIAATAMAVTVLKSDKNKTAKGKLLAISETQRQSLLDKMDEWGRGTLDWGLKPGQDHVEASIAQLREILEDTIYKTLP